MMLCMLGSRDFIRMDGAEGTGDRSSYLELPLKAELLALPMMTMLLSYSSPSLWLWFLGGRRVEANGSLGAGPYEVGVDA